jgi:hypothetical protein
MKRRQQTRPVYMFVEAAIADLLERLQWRGFRMPARVDSVPALANRRPHDARGQLFLPGVAGPYQWDVKR